MTRRGRTASVGPVLAHDALRIRRLGIDTYQEPVLYMRGDCPVCLSEEFEAQSRAEVTVGERSIVATLNVVDAAILSESEAGLSEAAWRMLGLVQPASGDHTAGRTGAVSPGSCSILPNPSTAAAQPPSSTSRAVTASAKHRVLAEDLRDLGCRVR
jgi:hypothetical protein